MNVTLWWDTPPNHDVGRVMASLYPQNVFLHLTGCLSTNLLAVVLLNFVDFLVLEEDVFVPILSVPLLLSIESRSEQDWRCVCMRGRALSCVDRPRWGATLDRCVQLSRHDLFPERISANPLLRCSHSGLCSQIFRRPNCLQLSRVPQNFYLTDSSTYTNFSILLRVWKFENTIFYNCEEQSEPHGFPLQPLHVDAVTDSSKLLGTSTGSDISPNTAIHTTLCLIVCSLGQLEHCNRT